MTNGDEKKVVIVSSSDATVRVRNPEEIAARLEKIHPDKRDGVLLEAVKEARACKLNGTPPPERVMVSLTEETEIVIRKAVVADLTRALYEVDYALWDEFIRACQNALKNMTPSKQ